LSHSRASQRTGGRIRAVQLLAISAAAAFVASAAGAAGLEVGDAAPDFTLQSTDGTTVNLRELVGKQAVVVAWFPKAFTPG